jgi:hypothetical protein
MGTAGEINFTDATGFIRTSAIYGRFGDDLIIDAATGATLTISGGAGAGIAQSLVSLIPDGSIVINNDTGTVPITDGNGLVISPEGQRITFPKDAATGLLNIGEIVGLSTINGTIYPPSGTSAFLDSFQIYVAPNGNNTTGTGSQQNPFLSITQAIIFRATLSTTTEVSIILSSGTYTETFTVLRNTYIVGVQTGEARQPVNIVGNITLNDTTGFMGLSGLDVSGTITTSGVGGTYTLFGCNITAGAANAIVGSAGTIIITECRISNTANTCIISSSTLTIRDCFITTASASSAIFATSTFTIRQSVIQSSSTSATALALVRFGNTGSSTVEISFCKLEYTSTTTDTGGNKCCVQFAGTGASTASIYNNLLLCEGAITGSPQIQCIQDTGTGAVNLSYGQLIAGATAHHISPATTKTAYTAVP